MKMNNKIIGFIKKYWILIVSVILILVVALSSIEIYREEVLHIETDLEYIEQDTLYFASERIDTLNPVVSQSEDVYYLSKLIYGSLFEFDENLGIVPDLVESYDVNTEKAFINIKLKDGIKWHNGKKLKASDVIFTVNAIKAAGSKSPYYKQVEKIVSCYPKNSSELSIYFRNNYNCSLDDLTFPIVCGAQFGSAVQFSNAIDGFKPIGTGQYRYKSYNKIKFLKLVPNEKYYGTVAEKKITFTILPEKDLAHNLMEINSVNCYVDGDADRKSIASDKNYQIFDFISNNVEFLVFNNRSMYTGNKKFRQAVAYSIDTNKILQNAYMNDGVLCDTIYYPNFLGVQDTHSYYERNIDKAEEMFASAGYYDKNSDGFLKNIFGEEIVLKIVLNKNNATRNSAARIIKEGLEEVGVNSEIIMLSDSDFKNAVKRRNFDILITGYTIDEKYDLRELFNGKNLWSYQNYQLLAAAVELDRLYTSEEYSQKYTELKKLLIDELPYYPLCYKKMSLIGNSRFKAGKMPMFNNIYKNCDSWSWDIVKEKEKIDKKAL